MAYQAMLKTKCCKLIRILQFHFLLVEEVCVDYGSITQMYLSPLRSEKSLVLQQNLANGDGGQAQKMWMKVGPQTMNEGWRFRLSQVTSEISSVRSLHQFTSYVIFLLLAALGYDANSTCSEWKGNCPPDGDCGIFLTVKWRKSKPRLRSSCCPEEPSVLFYIVHRTMFIAFLCH